MCSTDLGEWRRWRGAVNYGRRRRQATKEMWHRISLSTDLDCSKWRSCTPVSDHDNDDDNDDVVVSERVTERLPDFNENFQLPLLDCGTLSFSHVAYAFLRKPDARHCRAYTNSVVVANFFERNVNIRTRSNCVKWQWSWQWHWSVRSYMPRYYRAYRKTVNSIIVKAETYVFILFLWHKKKAHVYRSVAVSRENIVRSTTIFSRLSRDISKQANSRVRPRACRRYCESREREIQKERGSTKDPASK